MLMQISHPSHICHSLQKNTFQGLVITDGSRSYTVFTYKCGLLQWSGLDGFYPHAVIGYNFRGQLMNHHLSGSSLVLNVSCTNNSATPWSNLVYAIGDREDDLQRARGECLRRYNDDRREFSSLLSILIRSTQPCPCSQFQALRDSRFRFDSDRSVSQNPFIYHYIQRYPSLGISGQLCCYDSR